MSTIERQLTSAHPDVPEYDDLVECAIHDAYLRLRDRYCTPPGSDLLAPLAAVLDELDLGVSREQWDRVIDRLARNEHVHVRSEDDQKRLTEYHRFAQVMLGGTARHVITFTGPYRPPAPRRAGDVLPGREQAAASVSPSRIPLMTAYEQHQQRVDAALDHVRQHGTVRLDLSPDEANHLLAVLWTASDKPDTTPGRADVLDTLGDLLQQTLTTGYELNWNGKVSE